MFKKCLVDGPQQVQLYTDFQEVYSGMILFSVTQTRYIYICTNTSTICTPQKRKVQCRTETKRK